MNELSHRATSAARVRCGRWPIPSRNTSSARGCETRAADAWCTGITRSRVPQSSRVGKRCSRYKRSRAQTDCPRYPMAERIVLITAARRSRSSTVVRRSWTPRTVRATPRAPAVRARRANPARRPSVVRIVSSDSAGPAPGRDSTRSSGWTSRPSPPLEISAIRCTRSGWLYANDMAMPPPSEWPTIVTRRCPSTSSRSRSVPAWPPGE
jgi:hypothetical protein